MNLADWKARRICLQREGYLPKVIFYISWGGSQEEGPGQSRTEKVPIRAPHSHLPIGPLCVTEAG